MTPPRKYQRNKILQNFHPREFENYLILIVGKLRRCNVDRNLTTYLTHDCFTTEAAIWRKYQSLTHEQELCMKHFLDEQQLCIVFQGYGGGRCCRPSGYF